MPSTQQANHSSKEEKQDCQRDDLLIEMTYSLSVDDDGEPLYDVPSAEPNADKPYWCCNCWTSFNLWDEAKAHLTEQKAAA